MNMFGDRSPDMGPIQLAAGDAPLTPPHEDALDDVYGSDLSLQDFAIPQAYHGRAHEILSDLPSRQRALDTDAYREGLANSKGQFVQEGFDEGYSVGANLGLRAGYILGVLHGFAAGWKPQSEQEHQRISKLYEAARKELAIQELLGQRWVGGDGIWTWDVKGKDTDPTLREVAEQHPVVQKWMLQVEELARKYGIDLKAVEKHHTPIPDEGS